MQGNILEDKWHCEKNGLTILDQFQVEDIHINH